jgi:hypothetical protein
MAIAFTDQPMSGPFHRTTLWHRTAPRNLFKAWFSGDDEHRWAVWKKHLAQRKSPEPLEFLAGKQPPILWGWPASWRRDEIAHATTALARANTVQVASRSSHVDLPQALEIVAAAYALPDLAKELPAGAWWNLAETLHRLAGEAQQLGVDITQDAESIVRQQLLAGELPLTLGYLFPELQPMRSLRQPGRQALSEGLIAATDGEGLPHARLLAVIGPLWACWTRARTIGDELHRGAWSRDAETQYQWLLRRMIRLVDAGGRVSILDDEEQPSLVPILSTALQLVGDKGDCAATAEVISKSVVRRSLQYSRKNLPDASLDSAWSALAVLASGWSKQSPRLAVDFSEELLKIDLHLGGLRLLAGQWTMETRCDGHPITPTGTWQELCWQSDKKCDVLELGIELADGVQLERQMVLSKRDQVLLIADVLSSKDRTSHELQHSLNLPLGHRVAWLPELETRDGVLVHGKQRTSVLPLGLREWRSDPRGGSLSSDNGRLTLSEQASGRSLYCGLLLDLDPARSKKCRTWRQLTVSEMLQVVPRDVAVGFRAQSGDDQWLVYRSLGKAGNRAVLGQNISCEFYAGRVQKNGLVAEWIEIEAE